MLTKSLCLTEPTLRKLIMLEPVSITVEGVVFEMALCGGVLDVDIIGAVHAAGDALKSVRERTASVIPGETMIVKGGKDADKHRAQLEKRHGYKHVSWALPNGDHCIAPATPPVKI